MDAVANYTLEVQNNLVSTTINITFQEFIEARVRTCFICNITDVLVPLYPMQCQQNFLVANLTTLSSDSQDIGVSLLLIII